MTGGMIAPFTLDVSNEKTCSRSWPPMHRSVITDMVLKPAIASASNHFSFAFSSVLKKEGMLISASYL